MSLCHNLGGYETLVFLLFYAKAHKLAVTSNTTWCVTRSPSLCFIAYESMLAKSKIHTRSSKREERREEEVTQSIDICMLVHTYFISLACIVQEGSLVVIQQVSLSLL